MHKTKLSMRPIVSNRNTITYFTSKFLHNVLLKLVNKLPTICHNNIDIILDIEDRIFNDNTVLFIADI